MEFTQEEIVWLKGIIGQLQFKVNAINQGLLAKSIMDKLEQPSQDNQSPVTP